MKTAAAIERALSPRAVKGARRAVARELLARIEQDMQYLGWFVSIAKAYPESASSMHWSSARKVAARCRLPLQVAEALSRRTRPALGTPECDEPRAA